MAITVALPSKGRLKEKTLEVFAGAGFEIELPEDSRSYRGAVKGRRLPSRCCTTPSWS